ncbi:TetR/AcrR family transcriptional regulator [Nocardiopsis sp. RSe5-2]|uniref:TetR/AcrR family transcriptional regulator n=1 Tax=Nocardiopsis endophytica TaxID=3018445 RepID=A0ABT4TYT0_9ACTN|nr:TetR/AcrR family transcriptional regulator [Nocardiopsis endophytica]MDA2809858.1 TetR/AcrR family transcriptional regulator [Nocardiopsis endophytica]
MRSETEPGGQEAAGEQDRKRTFIEEARRAQIVQAAIAVIAEHGYDAASLARIARHAGISKGVISYHFAGKDELMHQVVVHVYTRIADHMVPRLDAAPDPSSKVRTYVLAVAEYMRANREQLMALGGIFTGARSPEGEPEYGFASNEPIYTALEGLLREGHDSGDFRVFDRRVMAVTMQGAIDAMFGYWAAHPDHDLEEHARELADLFDRATRA